MPWLSRVIRARLPSVLSVEDILQEVSLAVIRSESVPPGEMDQRRWLCKIAIRQCALAIRTHSRKQKLDQAASHNGADSCSNLHDPILWLIEMEKMSQLTQGLAQLDQESHQILKWKYFDKLSYLQIAERLSCTKDAAEYRVARIREELRRVLIGLGFDGEVKS